MTMLISYRHGKTLAIPPASISNAVKDDDVWLVRTLVGETHTVSNDHWEIALALTPVTSSPALPGTYIVSLCDDEDGSVTIDRVNVVAWTTCADGSVRPVTIDPGEVDGLHPVCVLMPDGAVESTHAGHRWKSLGEWETSGGVPKD